MRLLLSTLILAISPLGVLSQFTLTISSTAAATPSATPLPTPWCQTLESKHGRKGSNNCDSRCNSGEAFAAAARVCRYFTTVAPAPWRTQQAYADDGVTRALISNVDRGIVLDEAVCNQMFGVVINSCIKAKEAPESKNNPRNMFGLVNYTLQYVNGTGYAIFTVGSTKCVQEMGSKI